MRQIKSVAKSLLTETWMTECVAFWFCWSFYEFLMNNSTSAVISGLCDLFIADSYAGHTRQKSNTKQGLVIRSKYRTGARETKT